MACYRMNFTYLNLLCPHFAEETEKFRLITRKPSIKIAANQANIWSLPSWAYKLLSLITCNFLEYIWRLRFLNSVSVTAGEMWPDNSNSAPVRSLSIMLLSQQNRSKGQKLVPDFKFHRKKRPYGKNCDIWRSLNASLHPQTLLGITTSSNKCVSVFRFWFPSFFLFLRSPMKN
jgi:hypothetical protein